MTSFDLTTRGHEGWCDVIQQLSAWRMRSFYSDIRNRTASCMLCLPTPIFNCINALAYRKAKVQLTDSTWCNCPLNRELELIRLNGIGASVRKSSFERSEFGHPIWSDWKIDSNQIELAHVAWQHPRSVNFLTGGLYSLRRLSLAIFLFCWLIDWLKAVTCTAGVDFESGKAN